MLYLIDLTFSGALLVIYQMRYVKAGDDGFSNKTQAMKHRNCFYSSVRAEETVSVSVPPKANLFLFFK